MKKKYKKSEITDMNQVEVIFGFIKMKNVS